MTQSLYWQAYMLINEHVVYADLRELQLHKKQCAGDVSNVSKTQAIRLGEALICSGGLGSTSAFDLAKTLDLPCACSQPSDLRSALLKARSSASIASCSPFQICIKNSLHNAKLTLAVQEPSLGTR